MTEPCPWPDGIRSVGVLTFDVDGEIGVAQAMGLTDLSGRPMVDSMGRYGPEVGVYRILDMLQRLAVPATFFVPGEIALRYPQLVPDILRGGAEVAGHGYAHRRASELDAAEDLQEIRRGLAVLREQGATPVGYKVPFWDPGALTLQRVRAEGLLYDASLMDRDRPYVRPDGLVELPVYWTLDDWEYTGYLPAPGLEYPLRSAATWIEAWRHELIARHAAGALSLFTAHPWISGRPAPLAHLEAMVAEWTSVRDFAWMDARSVALRCAPARS